MRTKLLSAKSIMAGVAAATLFISSFAGADTASKYRELSDKLVAEGNAALFDYKDGDDEKLVLILFERALVANPANIQALIGLGKTHEAAGATGKGLKYYRQALEIEPNHLDALSLQGSAFLKRDMLERAEENRERLARICSQGCPQLDSLVSAIDTFNAQVAQVETKGEEGS